MKSLRVSQTAPRESRIWRSKKKSLLASLLAMAARSPVMFVKTVEDRGDEFRARVIFLFRTLVTPREGKVITEGPVELGVKYKQSFIFTPPIPWEVVTVTKPENFFHPNSGPGGGLCLGDLPAAVGMEAILRLAFAALTFNSTNTVDWEGLNPSAASFVREHSKEFPLLPTGVYEDPPAHLRLSLPGSSLTSGASPGAGGGA